MPPLLTEIAPAFAAELRTLLEKAEPVLAPQVDTLRLVDRCRCGEDFCAMFYTAPPPDGSYGPPHRNVQLEPNRGMILLDVIKDRIVAVEVLWRKDVKTWVEQHCP